MGFLAVSRRLKASSSIIFAQVLMAMGGYFLLFYPKYVYPCMQVSNYMVVVCWGLLLARINLDKQKSAARLEVTTLNNLSKTESGWHNLSKLELPKFLIKQLALSLVLILFYFIFVTVLFDFAPTARKPEFEFAYIININKEILLDSFGLFPASLYIFYAMVLGLLLTKGEGSSYTSVVKLSFQHKVVQRRERLAVLLFVVNNLVLCLSLSTVLLLLAQLFYAITNYSNYVFSPYIIILLFMFAMYGSILPQVKNVFRWLARHRLDLQKGLLLFALLFAILLVLHQYAIPLLPKLATLKYELASIEMLRIKYKLTETERIKLLCMGWWIILTPLVGSYLARLAYARSRLQLFLYLVCNPLLFFVCFAYLFEQYKINILNMLYSILEFGDSAGINPNFVASYETYLYFGVAILAFCLMLYFAKGVVGSAQIIVGFLPRLGYIKSKGISFYLPAIFMLSFLMCIAIIATRWYVIGIYVAVHALLVIYASIIGMYAVLRLAYKKS